MDIEIRTKLDEIDVRVKALHLAGALVAIARVIPIEERHSYHIPSVLDVRAIRNTLADQLQGNNPADLDLVDETRKAISGISRWFIDNLSHTIDNGNQKLI